MVCLEILSKNWDSLRVSGYSEMEDGRVRNIDEDGRVIEMNCLFFTHSSYRKKMLRDEDACLRRNFPKIFP